MDQKFERVMDKYFEVFKEKMNNRFQIPPKLVEDYKDDICFMVDYMTECTFKNSYREWHE